MSKMENTFKWGSQSRDNSDEIAKIKAEQIIQNNNIQSNTDNIKSMKNDLGDLGDQVVDLNNKFIDYYTKEAVDNSQDIQNAQIEANKTSIDNLIQQLKDSNIINYVGEYVAGKTYKLGQVVSYNDKLYLVKVESTTATPDTASDYDLLSSPEMGLDDFYNKIQVDNLLGEKAGKNTWLNGLTSTDIENANAVEFSYYLPNGNTTPYQRFDFINRNIWSGVKSAFTYSFFIQKEKSLDASTQQEVFLYDCAYINRLENKLSNRLTYMEVNRPFTEGNLISETIEGNKIYQCVIYGNEFQAGEKNLVNGSLMCFYDVSIYNETTKKYVNPEKWNLRYINDNNIRASIPEDGRYVIFMKVMSR